MSSSAPPGGDRPGEDNSKSVGKYVKRLKTVLRRGTTRRSWSGIESAAATASETPQPSTAAPSSSKLQPEAPSTQVTSVPGSRTFTRNVAQQERARALFAKYGLTLEPHEWLTTAVPNVTVQRVEKPIRMRVHRSCHRCKTQFGADRVCVHCQHRRCQKCPRYPPRKDKTKPKDSEAAARATDAAALPRKKPLLLITRDGKERTVTPIKQRVRRTCHHCQSLFNPPTRTGCQNCGHTRCVKCPRDPAKSKKYPNGYPGDAPASEEDVAGDGEGVKRPERTWKKPKMRVRWYCESCQTMFHSRSCQNCGHERGGEGCVCIREPPKKAKKEPDPEVVKSLEEKLAGLDVGNQPTVSTAA